MLINAQTEEEIKSQADKLFNTEQYVAATPLYLRLLSLQPRDHFYNFRYGTCLLFNSNNKQSAIKYLNYAVSEPTIPLEAYYFLGKAYHLDYQFNQAKKYYSIYIQKRPKQSDMYAAERAIEMCKNGELLLTTVSDVIVLEKKEIANDKFFRVYDLQDIGGNIIVTSEFQTKIDKKNGHVPLIHFPKNPTVIYYSSYGENAENGKEIYLRRKTQDGSWGNPELVQGQVNTAYDEDFPYLHPDGEYLYFSSKGHNSMGGYDVFRSKYNAQTNSFGKPENLDFAVSSPDDDLFYVVDSLNQNAYFASARQSEAGKLFVYKVKVDRVPLQLVVVNGAFSSDVDATPKQLNLEILSQESNSVIGKYTTDSESKYRITLPKGGNYEYVLKLAGKEQEFRSLVTIPTQTEFKPLKQKILHTSENGKETIRIVNLFNEEVTDMEAVIAEVVKMRSDLNVNVSEFNLEKIEAPKKSISDFTSLGFGNLSVLEVQDLLENIEEQVRKNQNFALTLKRKSDFFLVENYDKYEQIEVQIQQKLDGLNTTESTLAKKSILQQLPASVKELLMLKSDALATIPLQDSVRQVYSKSPFVLDVKTITAIREKFETAINAGKEAEAIAELVKNKELLQQLRNDNSMNFVENLIKKSQKLGEDILLYDSKNDRYKEEQIALQKEINYLETNLSAAKQKEITSIEQNIRSRKDALKLIEEEQKLVASTLEKLNQQKSILAQRIQLLETLISKKYIGEKNPEEVQKTLLELEKKNPLAWNFAIRDQEAKLDTEEKQLQEKSVQIESKEKEITAQELESKEPEVNSLAELLLPKYTLDKSAIEADNSLSTEQKMARLQKQDQALISAIETKLKEIEKQLVKNPENEPLLKEKAAIGDLKFLTESITEEREQMIESKLATKILPETIAKQKVVYSTKLDPSYLDKLATIELETSTSNKKQLLDLEQSFIKKIEEEELSVMQELRKDPLNITSRTNLQALAELKKEQSTKIAQINAAIVAEEEGLVLDKITEEDKKKIEIALHPDYGQKTKEIEISAQLTPVEKAVQLRKIEREKIEKIQLEKEVIVVQLEEDPKNRELLKEEKILLVLLEESNAKLAVYEQEIQVAQAPNTLTSEEKVLKYAEFKSDYSSNVRAIELNNSIGEEEALNLVQTEDQLLLGKIYDRQDQLEEQIERNPDIIALQKEQKILDILSSELESKIEVRQKKLTVLEEIKQKELAEKENAINKIDASYFSDLKIIKELAISETEKTEKLAQEDREILVKIGSRLDEISYITGNDTLAIQEKQILEKIRNDLQRNLLKSNQTLLIESNPEASISFVTRTKTYYNAQKFAIESKVNLKEEEKRTSLLDLENSILDQIRSEKMAIQLKKVADPTNTQLQQELASLNVFELEMETSIESRKNEINVPKDPVKVVTKQKILIEVFPEYESLVAELERSNVTEKNKIDRSLTLENKLLEKLQKEEGNIRKTKIGDASNSVKLAAVQTLILDEKEKIRALQEEKIQLLAQETEKDILKNQPTSDSKDPTLEESEQREIVLQRELTDPELSKQESQKMKTELAKIQEDKDLKEISEWREKISADSIEVKKMVAILGAINLESSDDNLPIQGSLQYQEKLNQQIQELQTNANATNNRSQEKYLLQKVFEQQQEMKNLVKSAIMEGLVTEVAEENEIEKLFSELDKQQKISSYTIRIGDLNSEILEIENTIKITKGVEKLKLEKSLSEKSAQRNYLNQQRAFWEEKKIEIPKIWSSIDTASIQQEITFDEEQKIALSQDFKEYELNYQRIINNEKEYSKLVDELNNQREDLKNLIQQNLTISINENYSLGKKIDVIKTLENEIDNLRIERVTLLENQNKLLQKDQNNSMKMQNLLVRGIKPISKLVIASALVAVPVSGLSFTDNNSTNSKNIIPVAIKTPSGLVYRVQVGAFLKPIPDNLFKEFTPVSSEKLNENGFTRYLAGYFNSSEKVVKARDQIKSLGYADAFAVAYCDGKRITLAEARILESNGKCIPKGENELNLEILENIASEIFSDDTLKKKILGDYTYNKAPDAVIAEPIEKYSGLFYTVQIGVFNLPTTAASVYNIDQLMTERLPNGRIKYTTGMYNSFDEAQKRKGDVMQLGAQDAFITAYYKGSRINLEDAQKLLEENGPSVLEVPIKTNKPTEQKLKIKDRAIAKLIKPVVPIEENNKDKLDVTENKSVVYTYNQAPDAAIAEPVEKYLGLFYTVQIGVFNFPATAASVYNIDQLMTERLPNGRIKYTTGMYNSFEEAQIKKRNVVELGVKDAFVTAYYKGIRINLEDAQILAEANGPVETQVPLTNSKQRDQKQKVKDTEIVNVIKPTLPIEAESNKILDVTENKSVDYSNNEILDTVNSEPIEKYSGLFYTVQIGVFNLPPTAASVYYLDELMTERLPNGRIKYTTGIYKSFEEALVKKRNVIELGAQDAFITAYYKGTRINLEDAQKLVEANGPSVLQVPPVPSRPIYQKTKVKDPEIAKEETMKPIVPEPKVEETEIVKEETVQPIVPEPKVEETEIVKEETVQPIVPEPKVEDTLISKQTELLVSSEESSANKLDITENKSVEYTYNQATGAAIAEPIEKYLGLFYTVQIGVFNLPATAESVFNIDDLMTERLTNGRIKYTTGIYNSFEEALIKKRKIMEIGAKDAFISAYYKGVRINLEDAQKLVDANGPSIFQVPLTNSNVQELKVEETEIAKEETVQPIVTEPKVEETEILKEETVQPIVPEPKVEETENVKEETVQPMVTEPKVEETEIVKEETVQPIVPEPKVEDTLISKQTELVVSSEESSTNKLDKTDKKVNDYSYNQAPDAAIAEPVEKYSGLFYTVQIGVFNLPATPASVYNLDELMTERLPNNRIKYTSGMYNSFEAALSKKRNIIELGAKDAFITAYYKGVRINLEDARKLVDENGPSVLEVPVRTEKPIDQKTKLKDPEIVKEETVQPIVPEPKIEEPEIVKEETVQPIVPEPKETVAEISEVEKNKSNVRTEKSSKKSEANSNKDLKEYTYNQSPDAAYAEPIEKYSGLFFTIQLGVYNRPATSASLNNVDQLMTLLLPNGQIKYTAGMFESFEDAIIKKKNVIEKGFKDPFITAYYKGNRITLDDAQQLIIDNGTSVLQTPISVSKPISNPINTEEEMDEKTTYIDSPEKLNSNEQRIQIVSKKQYNEFPREILNRYNSHGSFYYDETDKRVKSAIASTVEELPAVYYFKDAVDTIYLKDEFSAPSKRISVVFESSSLPGDLIDWLLRLSLRKEFKQSENTIELIIYKVSEGKLKDLEAKLSEFGLEYKVYIENKGIKK